MTRAAQHCSEDLALRLVAGTRRERAAGLWPRAEERLVRLFDTLLAWQERASERHRLAGLDDRYLRDMGLSRADVAGEVDKPFWRG